jgi:hypothetical protein
LADTLNKIITHYRWLTTVFIMNICSPIFKHSTPMSYSSFTHYILAVNPPRIIHDRLPQHSCFSVKKEDNSANFAAGRIINHRIHHHSLCRDKNKH